MTRPNSAREYLSEYYRYLLVGNYLMLPFTKPAPKAQPGLLRRLEDSHEFWLGLFATLGFIVPLNIQWALPMFLAFVIARRTRIAERTVREEPRNEQKSLLDSYLIEEYLFLMKAKI